MIVEKLTQSNGINKDKVDKLMRLFKQCQFKKASMLLDVMDDGFVMAPKIGYTSLYACVAIIKHFGVLYGDIANSSGTFYLVFQNIAILIEETFKNHLTK